MVQTQFISNKCSKDFKIIPLTFQMIGELFFLALQITGGKGGAENKIEAMKSAGIQISNSPAALGSTLLEVVKNQN